MSLLRTNTFATCIHKILSPNQNIMLQYFGAFFSSINSASEFAGWLIVSKRDSCSFVSRRCVLLMLLQDMYHCKTNPNWFMWQMVSLVWYELLKVERRYYWLIWTKMVKFLPEESGRQIMQVLDHAILWGLCPLWSKTSWRPKLETYPVVNTCGREKLFKPKDNVGIGKRTWRIG